MTQNTGTSAPEPIIPDDCCKECLYWLDAYGKPVHESMAIGFCHVNAPILVLNRLTMTNGEKDFLIITAFPETLGVEWCGQFQAAEDHFTDAAVARALEEQKDEEEGKKATLEMLSKLVRSMDNMDRILGRIDIYLQAFTISTKALDGRDELDQESIDNVNRAMEKDD